jgi:hypothetical protein
MARNRLATARVQGVMAESERRATRRPGQYRRMAAAAGLALLAAGCGSGPAAGSRPFSPASQDSRAGQAAGQPVAGSRAQARALAGRLLAELALPADARMTVPYPVPALLQHADLDAGRGHTIDLHKFFSTRQSAGSAGQFLLAHVPAGLTWSGNGTAGDAASGQEGTFVSDTARRLPAGIYQADLVLTLVPATRGSLLRADAEVTWFPPRTPAEHVDPARFRAVIVAATFFNPGQHTVRRTFTDRPVIARLARSLNSLHADPGLDTPNCPAITASYRIDFVPASPGQPPIVAVPGECLIVQMSAGGHPAPDLLGSSQPIAVITRLPGLRAASRTARH